jgi:DNA-binding transcriptional LysR family regulator
MPTFDDLHLFVLTVRHKGISSAAQAVGMQRSKLSRHLQNLEQKLGFQLLIRTTRSIELTDQGRWLFQQVSAPLMTLTEIMEVLEDQKSRPHGKLKIAIPPVLGVTEFFTQVIETYISKYPDVEVVVEHQTKAVDLRRTNVDIQVLPIYHRPICDDFIQQHLVQLPCSMVASPEYLMAKGEPISLEDLSQHLLLGSRYSKTQLPSELPYYVYSEDLHLLRNLARDGKGITLLPNVMVEKCMSEKQLVPVLSDVVFERLQIKLVYASLPYLTEKSRSMIHLLRETLKEKGIISYPV